MYFKIKAEAQEALKKAVDQFDCDFDDEIKLEGFTNQTIQMEEKHSIHKRKTFINCCCANGYFKNDVLGSSLIFKFFAF